MLMFDDDAALISDTVIGRGNVKFHRVFLWSIVLLTKSSSVGGVNEKIFFVMPIHLCISSGKVLGLCKEPS